MRALIQALGSARAVLVLVAGAVALRAGGPSWALAAPAWGAAGLAVLALALEDVGPGEVAHLVFAVEAIGLLGLGAALALGARAIGLGAPVAVAALVVPALARHVALVVAAREALAREIGEPRLGTLALPELIVEAGRSPRAAALARLVLERPGAREVVARLAREGSLEERRGAVEVAIFAGGREHTLARDVARAVLGAADAADELLRRALVLVRTDGDSELVSLLRTRRPADPKHRTLVLEARARAGDASALDDWLQDRALDPDTTGAGIALALGPVADTRRRLESSREAHAVGSVERERLERLLEALAIFS